MPKVKMLERELYELIAAGEVIDRPSSVIKELAENSIDSGASVITCEIKQGGVSYMRVTDNGCGIDPDDISTAFLRHATSKIASADDLSNISTLGFRGEALASVAAVSKVNVLTKVKENMYGAHYIIEGTEEKLCEQAGCPDGTTVVIRDIFYNVPARLKFLKKDVAEGNDIARIMEKIALSHPEISVRFIRDNKQVMFTPGDNKLYSAIYSVMGKQFAASLIPVDYSLNGIFVTGFTVKPLFGMKNRRLQNFFVNGRYIQSYVLMRSVEEAYKNSIMEGKFPACVLFININASAVDVNVHPQKTEVRFTDERAVYEAVYFAVKNALLSDSVPEDITIPQQKPDYYVSEFADKNIYEQTKFTKKTESTPHISAAEYVSGNYGSTGDKASHISAESYRSMTSSAKPPQTFSAVKNAQPQIKDTSAVTSTRDIAVPVQPPVPPQPADNKGNTPEAGEYGGGHKYKVITNELLEKEEKEKAARLAYENERKKDIDFRLVGEAYKTYIIAETDTELVFIDKHAAHERINFERMRSGEVKLVCQMLLEPAEVRLSYSQYSAVCKNSQMIEELGFNITPLDAPAVRVNGIPSILDVCDSSEIVAELAQNLDENRCDPMPEILDDMLHSIACKASVRANDNNSSQELEMIVKRLFTDERIRYCPHGRPVMFKLSKRELEKQFKRIE